MWGEVASLIAAPLELAASLGAPTIAFLSRPVPHGLDPTPHVLGAGAPS